MDDPGSIDERRLFLATAIATPREKRIAHSIALAALVAFTLIWPFARVPLPAAPAFIPSYEAALFFIDIFTAVLLYDQFVRLRSPSVLALASGYLFDALMIVPHALTFPGAFTRAGLLGAGEQTTGWLYVFWHGGFPLFVMTYALLQRGESRDVIGPVRRVAPTLGLAVGGVILLAVALTLLTTWGHDLLPVMIRGKDYSLAVTKGVTPAVWVLTLIAMLLLWRHEQRVIDLWVMLVMWVWLFDIALSSVIGSSRFDLGWYAGRIAGLIAAAFLLITLLVEMAQIYAGAVGAAARAEVRLAELIRWQTRSEVLPPGQQTNTFVLSQNVSKFRALLASGRLNESQRAVIERLLSEEEKKLREKELSR
jgi:two-component system sensor histidine kinase UhpB